MKMKSLTPFLASLVFAPVIHAQHVPPIQGMPTVFLSNSQALKNAHNYANGKLIDVRFGTQAQVTIQPDTGANIVISVPATAKFTIDRAASNLTGFASKYSNQTVFVDYKKEGGNKTLIEMWDRDAWTAWLNPHVGVQGSHVKSINRAFIEFSSTRYRITNQTQYEKAGKKSNVPLSFPVGQMAYVKGEIQDGEPVAVIISDTQEGAQGTATAGNTRPDSQGTETGSRPRSSGTPGSRPNSATGKAGKLPQKGQGMATPPGTKPLKGGKNGTAGTAPAGADPKKSGTGSGQAAPSQAPDQHKRPDSAGKRNSPSERTATLYALSFQYKFTNTADPIPNNDSFTETARAMGAKDMTVEFFGSLKFDGKIFWEIERKDAKNYKKKAGEVLDLRMKTGLPEAQGSNGFLYIQNSSVRIQGSAFDDDDMTHDDVMYKANQALNLAVLDGKGWTKVSGQSWGADLYVKVQKVVR